MIRAAGASASPRSRSSCRVKRLKAQVPVAVAAAAAVAAVAAVALKEIWSGSKATNRMADSCMMANSQLRLFSKVLRLLLQVITSLRTQRAEAERKRLSAASQRWPRL